MTCEVMGSRVLVINDGNITHERRAILVCSEDAGHKGRHYDSTMSLEFGRGLGRADDDAVAA